MLIRKSVSKIGRRLSTDAFSSGIFLDGDLFVELLSLSLWGNFFLFWANSIAPQNDPQVSGGDATPLALKKKKKRLELCKANITNRNHLNCFQYDLHNAFVTAL